MPQYQNFIKEKNIDLILLEFILSFLIHSITLFY